MLKRKLQAKAVLHLLPNTTKNEKAGHCKIILSREVMCLSTRVLTAKMLFMPPEGTATLNQCKNQQSAPRALVKVQIHTRPVDMLSCLHARLCLQAASWCGGVCWSGYTSRSSDMQQLLISKHQREKSSTSCLQVSTDLNKADCCRFDCGA